MRKKLIFAMTALLVVAIAGTGSALAYSSWGNSMHGTHGAASEDTAMDAMHDEMQEVLENGDYTDLQDLRERYDRPMMHWVDSQEDFEQAQQMEHGPREMGPHHGGAQRDGYGCPMHN